MMRVVPAVVHDAAALFGRSRDLLIRIAAPFLFLPAFALALLVPPPPEATGADEAATRAWTQAMAAWVQAHGGWHLLSYAIALWGMATLYALFLDGRADTVGAALRRGLTLLPRLLLAGLVVALPVMAGLLLWVVPGLYILGRLSLVGPALVAERPLGVGGAIVRSLALTRRRGLAATALATMPVAAEWLIGQPLFALDAWMRTGGRLNPVALAVVDATSALVAMLAGLAHGLLAIALYRRVVRSGT